MSAVKKKLPCFAALKLGGLILYSSMPMICGECNDETAVELLMLRACSGVLFVIFLFLCTAWLDSLILRSILN